MNPLVQYLIVSVGILGSWITFVFQQKNNRKSKLNEYRANLKIKDLL
ncbi:MAG: hypothetical protein HRT63_13910 [Erythrobacter sp.]|nr:hypothetical protein [Erythrobacter sp.]